MIALLCLSASRNHQRPHLHHLCSKLALWQPFTSYYICSHLKGENEIEIAKLPQKGEHIKCRSLSVVLIGSFYSHLVSQQRRTHFTLLYIFFFFWANSPSAIPCRATAVKGRLKQTLSFDRRRAYIYGHSLVPATASFRYILVLTETNIINASGIFPTKYLLILTKAVSWHYFLGSLTAQCRDHIYLQTFD